MGTTKTRKLPEAALFAPLKAWFEARGYKVFAEVPCYSSFIDLVAIHQDIVIAVELKTSLTKKVIHQARRNDLCSDASYVAVGTKPRDPSRCSPAGVGLLTVKDGNVRVILDPQLKYPMLLASEKQKIIERCRSGACPEVGGVPCLEGVGPAKDCKARCDAYKVDHPKTTWREIFANVPNHYASHNSMRQSLTVGLEKCARIKEQRKQRRERERGTNVATKSAKKKAKRKKKAKKRKIAIRSGVRKIPPKAPKPTKPKVAEKATPTIEDVVIRDRIKEFRRVKASDILPDPDNWRTHPRAQKNAVAAVLREIGYADALLARETPEGLMLIDGHLRRDLTPNQEIPVLVLDVNEEEAHKMLVTLDPLAAMAGADKESLKGLMDSISTDSEALQKMLDDLAIETGIAPPPDMADEGPDPCIEMIDELIRKWGAKSGQIWSIASEDPGRTHRVKCGDSTVDVDVKALLDGKRPFLMVTDPPYGVSYDPEWRKRDGINSSSKMGKVANDDSTHWVEAYSLFPGAVAYVWHPAWSVADFMADMKSAGFEIRNQIIWNKPSLTISRGHYHWQHEPCLYGVRKGKTARWSGDRKQSTIWNIPKKDDTADTVHSRQKPVECMARPIRNHGQVGDIVYDPFLGSGTTILAAEQCGRSCYGMELDPGYLAVILERCEGFGLRPTLEDAKE